MGEMHDFFDSYGGEDAFIKAMSDDEEARIPPDDRSKKRRELRKARAKANGGLHSKKDVPDIRARQGDKCVYCSTKLDGGGHVDHILPLSLGGSSGHLNVQLTCCACNLTKGSSHPDRIFCDIKSFPLNRFRVSESTVRQSEILTFIGIEGVRSALFAKWIDLYKQASSENAAWRAKMKRRQKSSKVVSTR